MGVLWHRIKPFYSVTTKGGVGKPMHGQQPSVSGGVYVESASLGQCFLWRDGKAHCDWVTHIVTAQFQSSGVV